MLPIFLKEAVTACGGSFNGGNEVNTDSLTIKSVSIDSRTIEPGDFYIATPGERFDGHQFLKEALEKGACGAMVDEATFRREWGDPLAWLNQNFPQSFLWTLNDTRLGLGKLGAYHRKRFPNLPVIVVGGSNGKTSTKEYLRHTLSGLGPVVWSQASFNNDIGTPLTLLKFDSYHRAAVVEVGSNHPGEMQALLKLVQPTHAILTSIGREHLEFFKDLNGVIEEEGETLLALQPGSIFWGPPHHLFWESFVTRIPEGVEVVLNYPPQSQISSDPLPEKVQRSASWQSEVIACDARGTQFSVEPPVGLEQFKGRYHINSLGNHQVTNATYAIAVAAQLGVNPEYIRTALSNGSGAPMRMEIQSTGDGVQILNDAYNANAESMIAALQTLKQIPCEGKKWAVLGSMLELGSSSESLHWEVGKHVADAEISGLWVIGKEAQPLGESARKHGLEHVEFVEEVEGLETKLKNKIGRGDLVLLKASRGARLERVSKAWMQAEPIK